AENVTPFERDGEDWVRFDLIDKDTNVSIELPVERYVRVIQQSDKEGTRRPVVRMRIMLGNVKDSFDFTLADRSHLEQNMILGRNFLTDIAIVDVGRQYVQKPPQP
ncbi:MAG: RimK/LysX family protein, partial [Pseudomonadales bacterium]